MFTPMEETKKTRAVLLMAYGSPNNLSEIEPYYTDIRRGRKPTPELLEELTGRYAAIGGSSPLLRTTLAQAKSLEAQIAGYKIYVGMRHWTPWIREAIAEMKADGITEAVGIVMAPHYSSMSIAKYIENVEKAQELHQSDIKFNFIESWHDEDLYIDALIGKIAEAQLKFNEEERKHLHYIFTAHSLPERILAIGDPYKNQLLETCALIAGKMGISDWEFAFQSAGRTEEKWLGPDLLEVLDENVNKGIKSILVCSVGFIIDHLEVMYDIDIEARNHLAQKNVHLERARSLNDHPMLSQLFAQLIEERFASL